MDRREFIKGVLRGESNDRIPRSIYGAGRWVYRQAGLKIEDLVEDPQGFADKISRVYSALDTDIVFPGSGLNTFPAEALGGVLSFDDTQCKKSREYRHFPVAIHHGAYRDDRPTP